MNPVVAHRVRRVSSDLPAPLADRDGRLVRWLAECAGQDGNAELDPLTRLARLAADLLRAGRVPAFGEPVMLGREPVAIGLPDVDGVEQAAYQRALDEALSLGARMAATPWSPQQRPEMDRAIAGAIYGIRRLSSTGKSTMPLLEAAREAGMPFLHLGLGVYQIGWGSRSLRIDRSATERDAASGARLAGNKFETAALLRRAGLPAPVHRQARNLAEAQAAASRLGWPLVLKPVDGERGEGVSVDVASADMLARAFERARAGSKAGRVLVERQVPGVCHRLFVCAGRLLYAVRRLPRSVLGDGRHTVAELIAQENLACEALPVWLRGEPAPADAAAQAALASAGYTMDSVPLAGVPVPLRRIETTADGGFDEDVGAHVHPANLDIALRAARLLTLEVAGIDIISQDISRAWWENGAVINEINFSPLLGGGEISRRHLREYLTRVLPGGGRIPIEPVFDAHPEPGCARARQQARVAAGERAWLVSAKRCLAPDGEERRMAIDGLGNRLRALMLDREVDAVVVVAPDAAALRKLPI